MYDVAIKGKYAPGLRTRVYCLSIKFRDSRHTPRSESALLCFESYVMIRGPGRHAPQICRRISRGRSMNKVKDGCTPSKWTEPACINNSGSMDAPLVSL